MNTGCAPPCTDPWSFPAGTNSMTPVFQTGYNKAITSTGEYLTPTGQFYCSDPVGLPSAPEAVWVWTSGYNTAGCDMNLTIYFSIAELPCLNDLTFWVDADNTISLFESFAKNRVVISLSNPFMVVNPISVVYPMSTICANIKAGYCNQVGHFNFGMTVANFVLGSTFQIGECS